MKKIRGSLLLRYVVALCLVGLLYGLLFQLPAYLKRMNNIPREQTSAMRAAVAENIVRLSGLLTADAGSSNASESIGRLKTDVESSMDVLNDFLKKPPKGMDVHIVSELKGLLEQQDILINDFDSRYKALDKPLTYDPSEDLSLLDMSTETQEIAARARTASLNLMRIAASPTIKLQSAAADSMFSLNNGMLTLGQPAITALSASATCLSRVDDAATNISNQLSELIKDCDDGYKETRRLLYAEVLATLAGNDGKKLLDDYRGLLVRLDQAGL